MRGGDQFDDIQTQLDNIKQQITELKSKCNNSSVVATGIVEEVQQQQEPVSETVVESAPVVKSWQTDKNTRFKDAVGNYNVTLPFNRIIQLIDGKKRGSRGDIEWNAIKQQLFDANSIDEVKKVIANNKLSFNSSWIGGKTKKRRLVKKRSTHKRR